MSQYEQKDNSGAMFVNPKKESDSHPDRKGNAMIGGVEYWVSGWINESAKGEKYLKISFTPKEQAHNQGVKQVTSQVEQKQTLLEDDIPF